MSWENVDGKVNRFPGSFREAASNRGSVVDVLTSGGAEPWECLTWKCCCEGMTSGRRGEKTLQLCALSDALWFVVEQQPSCWISPYCKLHDKCTGEQRGAGGGYHFIQNRWLFVLRPKWQAAVAVCSLQHIKAQTDFLLKFPAWHDFLSFKMLSLFLSFQLITKPCRTDTPICNAAV